MKEIKQNLVRIYYRTLENIVDGGYSFEGEFIDFPKKTKLRSSKFYLEPIPPIEKERVEFEKTKIYIESIDTFDKAKEFGKEGAVLNMASATIPGGGVANGSFSQEEELCRRSNLLYSLYSYTTIGKSMFKHSNLKEGSYPLNAFSGIYSPCVCVYKESGTYNILKDNYTTDVITVPGFNRPKLNENGDIVEKHVKVIKKKMRQVFRIAIENKKTKLVLGAWGCGSFKNPPHHVAKLFQEVLEESEFKRSFSEICFAILEDDNSKINSKLGNFKTFNTIFKNVK